MHDERIDELRRLSDQRWRDEIQRVVDAGVAAGEFHVVDSVRTTLRIACLMDGLAVQTVLGGAGLTPDDMATEWLTGAAHELGIDPAELLERVAATAGPDGT